jgi:hypothetical protein
VDYRLTEEVVVLILVQGVPHFMEVVVVVLLLVLLFLVVLEVQRVQTELLLAVALEEKI